MQGKSARLLAGLLVALAAAGCAGKAATNINPGPDNDVQGGPGIAGLVDLSGHDFKVGEVSGASLTGSQVRLADLPGKLIVVNFWGSWCAPCVAEADGFGALSKSYASKGVSFLGIDERDNTKSALAFDRAHKITYPSIFDQHDSLLLEFPGAVPATTPTTILVDSTGHILAKVSGPIEYTGLRSLVNRYLAVAA